MKLGRRKRSCKNDNIPVVQTVSATYRNDNLGFSKFECQSKTERELYSSLRSSVPIIDAAICKIIRLIGKFEVETEDVRCQHLADSFIKNVKTNGSVCGMYSFIYSYLDSLLTYGEAVGEMVIDSSSDNIYALYNASLDDVVIMADKSPLDLVVYRNGISGATPVKFGDRVFATLLNPKPGTIHGSSVLSGLPFVSSILLRIFESIKTNWERVGDVRFAVTYNPESGGAVMTKENALLIADEWKKAMRSDSVCDFVSVGDVSIKVIGAESVMPDCDVPVRHILEQIIAKLGIPPFMLGISWSSTERMSEQQADILTSELEHYRRIIEPVITKIITTHLRLNGYGCGVHIKWNEINLQDAVELSQARLNNANALNIEMQVKQNAKTEVMNE